MAYVTERITKFNNIYVTLFFGPQHFSKHVCPNHEVRIVVSILQD